MRIISYCVLVLVYFSLGIAALPILAQVAPPPAMGDQGSIIIGPGDLLDISVFDVPELVLKARVDSNGIVNLPLLGDQKLAGLSVRDAQMLIARELVEREFVRKPEVTVLIEEFATQGITVSGEVSTPGIYPLVGPHRLYDAISAAGGLTAKAGRTVSILRGGRPDQAQIVTLPDGASFEQADVIIYPGDTVIASKAGVVYVVGEVGRPGAFLMENNTTISLLKAVALAQGTTKLASMKHVLILRKSSGGTLQYEIPLNKVDHGEVADPQLHAEDIVFVPLSNVKNYGAIGLQGAIQAAVASLYIFRP